MSRHIIVALLVSVGAGMGVASVAAQSANVGLQPLPVSAPPLGSPVPPPGGPPVKPPGPALYDSTSVGLPFDFVFKDRLFGVGFKPGERVSIDVSNGAISGNSAVADAAGNFAIDIQYRWDFCGAGGSHQAPPTFSARGNSGSQAMTSHTVVPCPLLSPDARSGVTAPELGNPAGSVGGGTAVVSGTAVSGPAPGPASPPGPRPAPVVPPRAPIQTTLALNGFGFVAGETVTVRQVANGAFAPLPAVSARADAQGRIAFSIQAMLPPLCASSSFTPELLATGDAGTSVVDRIVLRQLVMIACPFQGPPSVGPGTPIPPGRPEPSAPSPDAVPSTASTGMTGVASLHLLQPAPPGAVQHATVTSGTAGTVHFRIAYPAGKRVRFWLTLQSPGQRSVHWQVPRHTHRGTAHLSAAFTPGGATLRSDFRVP